MMKNSLQAKELAVILSVSKSKAGQIIRELNKELEDEGYIAIRGRIPVQLARKKIPLSRLIRPENNGGVEKRKWVTFIKDT